MYISAADHIKLFDAILAPRWYADIPIPYIHTYISAADLNKRFDDISAPPLLGVVWLRLQVGDL